MELVKTNDEHSFDPTPKLKSSPIPIKFISFNSKDKNCVYCGEEYIIALCSYQKYCKKCLSRYINHDITDKNTYLDVYIYTMDLECSEHEISRTKIPQNIQECCRNCLIILCFKQMIGYFTSSYGLNNNKLTIYNKVIEKVIESEKYCKLCGKSFEDTPSEYYKIKLCSGCYLLSSEWIDSTLVKKRILVLYLPWWNNNPNCNACDLELTFTSDCQKYCTNCFIFYVGCRHCLTNNIIYGPALESRCKKCKRISFISEHVLDSFPFNNDIIFDNLKLAEIANIIKNIDKYYVYYVPMFMLNAIFGKISGLKQFKCIPYSQFKDIKELTKGGYGIIYKANWSSNDEIVILKRFVKSINTGKSFLNELESYQHCVKDSRGFIITTYGFTKDLELDEYILVMKYASEGDLHKYLQKNFTKITWNRQKLLILWQISEGYLCFKFIYYFF
ncbi:unnamed protein product [Rhizophagus irregularis]|nr:unnamed protein product [Rhizophagus irregularis]